ncbi:MAG: hypothetical protein WCD18_20485 [Thermosynechococcaceae cyanobacterium]
MQQSSEDPSPDKIIDFLIADFEHFGDSFWRNEEVGEKRFNYFLTLVSAVLAGLVTLHTSNNSSVSQALRSITNASLGGLCIFGFVTYLRMLKRNSVTDEYKNALKNIRKKICSFYPLLNSPNSYSPFSEGDANKNEDMDKSKEKILILSPSRMRYSKPWLDKAFRIHSVLNSIRKRYSFPKAGGLAESVATIEVFLIFILCYFNSVPVIKALGFSLLLLVILLLCAARRKN